MYDQNRNPTIRISCDGQASYTEKERLYRDIIVIGEKRNYDTSSVTYRKSIFRSDAKMLFEKIEKRLTVA